MKKKHYTFDEVKLIKMLEHDYHEFVHWYAKEGYKELLEYDRILDKPLEFTTFSLKKVKNAMAKYPEFFDETQRKTLDQIGISLEKIAYAQTTA